MFGTDLIMMKLITVKEANVKTLRDAIVPVWNKQMLHLIKLM